MSSGPVSSGVAKSATTWSLIIDTTTNSTNFPAGIRKGDAVFSFIVQAGQFSGTNAAFFNQPYGTKIAGYETVSFFAQTNSFTHLKNQITFIAGTDTLSGTPVGSGGTTFSLCRYAVFRRSPDYFDDPVLSYLGTQVTTSAYTSRSIPYTGSPSVILGMASTSRMANNAQTCTIGGVTPTLIAKNADTASFGRLWYRLNITPATLTTVGTSNATSGAWGWTPFVVH